MNALSPQVEALIINCTAMAWALDAACPSPSAKLVLAIMARHSDHAGGCTKNLSEIAACTGLKVRQVGAIVRELCAAELVVRERRSAGRRGRLPDRFNLQIEQHAKFADCSNSRAASTRQDLQHAKSAQCKILHVAAETPRAASTTQNLPVAAAGKKEIPPTPPKEKTTSLGSKVGDNLLPLENPNLPPLDNFAVEPKPMRKAPGRRSRIDPDLKINQRNRDDARKKGVPDSVVDREFAAFVDSHLGRGTLGVDWDATWRTWLAAPWKPWNSPKAKAASNQIPGVGPLLIG